jgi:hypothetical protein
MLPQIHISLGSALPFRTASRNDKSSIFMAFIASGIKRDEEEEKERYQGN